MEEALEIIRHWKTVWTSSGAEVDYLEYPERPAAEKLTSEPQVQTLMAVTLNSLQGNWTVEALVEAATHLNQPPARRAAAEDWLRKDAKEKLEIHHKWTQACMVASLTNTYTKKVVQVASFEIFDSSIGLCLITTVDGENYYFGRSYDDTAYKTSLDCLSNFASHITLVLSEEKFVYSAH
jgi:hypothetical protein